MENKLDSLFKKKLEEHSLPPREDAWARVEANLPKKNNVIAWRIAAAILFAGALIAVGVFTVRKSDAPTLAKKSEPVKSIDSVSRKDARTRSNSEEEKNQKSNVVGEEHPQRQYAKRTQTKELQNISRKDAETRRESKVNEPIQEITQTQQTILNEEVKQNLKSEATTITQTTSTSIEKPIKLEFTLEEVATDQTAVADTETKNSGLKKMWEKALQIKNGEGPVNQLLEKKDELFALNFKKEKQKTQH